MSMTRLRQTAAMQVFGFCALRHSRSRWFSDTTAVAVIGILMSGISGCDRIPWPWLNPEAQDQLLLSGTVDAREVDLSFQVGGHIRKLHADEGDTVENGQTVAELDPRDFELTHARTRAEVAAAEQQLAVLEAGARAQEIRAAEATVRQADADLKLARISRQRTVKLVAEKFESPQQLDAANEQVESASARLDGAREQLSLLREGARKEDIERTAAERDAAVAAEAFAEQQLTYTRLVSTVRGTVSVRLAERGQNVAAGQGVLRIAQIDQPWVRIYLSAADLPLVKLGQRAQVTVDGLPGKTFEGRLSFISPEAEFTPKTVETHALRVDLVYRAKVDVDNTAGELKIGMPADVRFARTP
jgi:HlyD family secretion protein